MVGTPYGRSLVSLSDLWALTSCLKYDSDIKECMAPVSQKRSTPSPYITECMNMGPSARGASLLAKGCWLVEGMTGASTLPDATAWGCGGAW